MFCPNCGNQIPDGSAFCPQCGYNFNVGNNQFNTGNNQFNAGNNQFNAQMQNAGNDIAQLFKEALANALEFLKAPKNFIKNFISSSSYNQKLPIAFFAVEAVLGLLFSLICNGSIKGIVSYYVEKSTGGYSSYSEQTRFIVNKMFEGTFFTIFIWTIVIILLMWLCRFAFSKLAASPANQNKVFSLLSVFASIQIVQWLFNIVFIIIFTGSLKIDPSSFMNSGYSSSNSLAQLQTSLEALNRFKGIMFVSGLFTIIVTLLYTFNVFVIKRTTDELETSDALPVKKATILVIAFAVILIIFNNYSSLFVFEKICKKIFANAISIGAASSFGF